MPARGWNRAAALANVPDEYRTVFGVPPEPWPAIPDSYVFGSGWEPAGTTYVFDERSAIQRAAEHGNSWAWFLEHVAGITRLVDGTATWRVPMRYARAQIVAALPDGESMVHSLALRPTDESTAVNGQVLHDLAIQLQGFWANFLVGDGASQNIHHSVSYNQINISYIEQTQGTDKSGKGGDAKTLVPTIQVPWSPPQPGMGQSDPILPLEVAMCLTLQTDTRGASTRGRLYLGGLSSDAMGANGRFQGTRAQGVANSFGINFVQAVHDHTTWRLNIVSRRHATGREVQGIAVGLVPDAQRRRRKSENEGYIQAWGTPPGAIPPG